MLMFFKLWKKKKKSHYRKEGKWNYCEILFFTYQIIKTHQFWQYTCVPMIVEKQALLYAAAKKFHSHRCSREDSVSSYQNDQFVYTSTHKSTYRKVVFTRVLLNHCNSRKFAETNEKLNPPKYGFILNSTLFFSSLLRLELIAFQCTSLCDTMKWISCMHTHPLLLGPLSHPPLPSLQVITEPWPELPALCSRFPLVIYFICGSVRMSPI